MCTQINNYSLKKRPNNEGCERGKIHFSKVNVDHIEGKAKFGPAINVRERIKKPVGERRGFWFAVPLTCFHPPLFLDTGLT